MHPLLSRATIAPGQNNVLTGFAIEDHIDKYSFNEQLNSFNNRGFAVSPTGNYLVGNVVQEDNSNSREKRKRRAFGDASEVNDFSGPWAPFEEEENIKEQYKKLTDTATEEMEEAVNENKQIQDKYREQAALANEEEEEAEDKDNKKPKKEKEVIQAKSIFHGTELKDYLGRSYVDPPSHIKPADHHCFLPKKLIHTWTGHTKGVNTIRYFPEYGHLLLSASMDTKVKLWDVYNKMQCIRTFMGHSKGVRDICFTNDGRKFISAGYDKIINLWDTETGECIGSYSNGRIPYCVKFNPDSSRQNLFLAGCADKKIYQWDVNSGKIVQTYDQHLGPVNTITFIDNNRRFVTTSDDKSIRVWEWGIPVVIKYISEPHMHSMPAVTVHPNGKWFLTQSLDNQILCYSATERFRMNHKKRFTGHVVAGFACQPSFSPDGRYLISGDSEGKTWIWDWKTCKVLKTIKCHQGVCISALWHPIEPSRVATCGWDGAIKYWD